MKLFKFELLKEAAEFVKSLPQKARKKVSNNMERVAAGESNAALFKKLDGSDIWEFRTLYEGVCYRLFAFWDPKRKSYVIATHGIVKKTQKTPKKEISKAEAIRKQYLTLNNG